MLMTIIESSPENSSSESTRAVSVLPTPDGPHSMNTPTGLFGLSSLARLVWMRLPIASIA